MNEGNVLGFAVGSKRVSGYRAVGYKGEIAVGRQKRENPHGAGWSITKAHACSRASSPAVMWFVIPVMREIMGDPARH